MISRASPVVPISDLFEPLQFFTPRAMPLRECLQVFPSEALSLKVRAPANGTYNDSGENPPAKRHPATSVCGGGSGGYLLGLWLASWTDLGRV